MIIAKGHDINASVYLDISITPLVLASREGHIEIVKFLIKKSANVNKLSGFGWTALLSASYAGHTEIEKF